MARQGRRGVQVCDNPLQSTAKRHCRNPLLASARRNKTSILSISTSRSIRRTGVRQCSPILTFHRKKTPCIETVFRSLSPPPPKFQSILARSFERSCTLPTQPSKTARDVLKHRGGEVGLISFSRPTETSLCTYDPLAYFSPESSMLLVSFGD